MSDKKKLEDEVPETDSETTDESPDVEGHHILKHGPEGAYRGGEGAYRGGDANRAS